MKKSLFFALISLVFISWATASFACTNLMVCGNGHVVVARTMDFEFNTGNKFAVGFPNEKNFAQLNNNPDIPTTQDATWISKHGFIGQSWLGSNVVVDGVNDAGVYAAYLYMPDFTEYPTYKASDKRPVIGTFDTVNYVLAMADSTEDAIKQLKKLQEVQNSIAIFPDKTPDKAGIFPAHVIIRDKTGHSAVIEWREGKAVVYDQAGPVLTNAPSYPWQLKHAKQFDYVSQQTVDVRYDGKLAIGTGFTGVPGDWSSVGRFSRATQVLNQLSAPDSANDALADALAAIDTAKVPPNTNPAITLWEAMADLENGNYYFKSFYHIRDEKKGVYIADDPMARWQKYNVNQITQSGKVPHGWIHAQFPQVSRSQFAKIYDFMHVTANNLGVGSVLRVSVG